MTQPCPFCGSSSVATAPVFTRRTNSPRYAYCRVCGARGPNAADQPDALAAWSSRAEPQQTQPPRPKISTTSEARAAVRRHLAEFGPTPGDDLREAIGIAPGLFWTVFHRCRQFEITARGWALTAAGRREYEGGE